MKYYNYILTRMQIETDSAPVASPREFSFTVEQKLYLSSHLPKCFTIQSVAPPIVKPVKEHRDHPVKNKSVKNIHYDEDQSSVSKSPKELEKTSSTLRKQKSKQIVQPKKQEEPVPKKIKVTEESIAPQLKLCWKLLQTLKKHPSSWPFLEPVDPIALGIPTYFNVIKEPMDFSTIETNLGSGTYETQTQFHADIGKVFMNSLRFNSKDSEVHMLTKEVQQFYENLVDQPDLPVPQKSRAVLQPQKSCEIPKKPSIKRQPDYQMPAKVSKKKKVQPLAQFNAMTIAEKKQLGQNIRKLPRDSLKGVWEIVNDGNTAHQELKFDIDKLPVSKARELQRYVNSQLKLSLKTPFHPKESLQTSQTYRERYEQSDDASSFMVSQQSA